MSSPGWHPDPRDPEHRERWWDGEQWGTDSQTRPTGTPGQRPPRESGVKGWWNRLSTNAKVGLVAGVAVLLVLGAVFGEEEPSGDQQSAQEANDESTGSDESDEEDTPDESGEEEPAPAKPVTFAEGEASGDFAIATADGTIDAPQDIRVLVNATPDQEVQLAYTATCTQGAGGAGSVDDQTSATTPIDETIKLPSSDVSDCIVAATAQLETGGEVRVRLRGTEGG